MLSHHVARETYNSIVKQVLDSNLNFQLQLSPFSCNISMRKPPIKDQAGELIPAKGYNSSGVNMNLTSIAALKSKNEQLERDVFSLREQLAETIDECDRRGKVLSSLMVRRLILMISISRLGTLLAKELLERHCYT